MKCPKCKSKMFITIKFLIEMPAEDEGRVTKRKLQTKDYQILAAFWNDVNLYHCKKCGYRKQL